MYPFLCRHNPIKQSSNTTIPKNKYFPIRQITDFPRLQDTLSKSYLCIRKTNLLNSSNIENGNQIAKPYIGIYYGDRPPFRTSPKAGHGLR